MFLGKSSRTFCTNMVKRTSNSFEVNQTATFFWSHKPTALPLTREEDTVPLMISTTIKTIITITTMVITINKEDTTTTTTITPLPLVDTQIHTIDPITIKTTTITTTTDTNGSMEVTGEAVEIIMVEEVINMQLQQCLQWSRVCGGITGTRWQVGLATLISNNTEVDIAEKRDRLLEMDRLVKA